MNAVGIAGLGGAQGVRIFAAHSGGLRSEMKGGLFVKNILIPE